jgi:hypothetical protein
LGQSNLAFVCAYQLKKEAMTTDELIALLMRETGCTKGAAKTALIIMQNCQRKA